MGDRSMPCQMTTLNLFSRMLSQDPGAELEIVEDQTSCNRHLIAHYRSIEKGEEKKQ